MQRHSCLLWAVYFNGALVSVKMYLVEKFPYGLSQTVLHTLLGGSIGTLFKSKIGHQKALSVISSNRLLWQNSALVKRQAETLTPDWFRGKYAVLGILMIWVSEFFTAASQNDSFSLAKVSQCAKAILRRCTFRHLKKTAILPPRRSQFFSRQSAAVH